jgi:hypothetical protein
MTLRISVFASSELRAVILGLKQLDREVKKQIRQQTKVAASEMWTQSVREHAVTRLEQRVLADTARVRVSDQNVTLSSASVGRSLKGGLKPSDDFAAVEFGADRSKTTTYAATSRRGRRFTVHNRHTRHQLRNRNRKGFAVYPAAADDIPRLASLWVQTIVRALHEALEAGDRG